MTPLKLLWFAFVAFMLGVTVAFSAPGPGPTYSPWFPVSGGYAYSSGCVLLPASVTGGCKGVGTINVNQLWIAGSRIDFSKVVFGGLTANGASPLGNNVLTIPTSDVYTGGGNLSVYASLYGWGSSATVLCVQANLPSNSPCPVEGGASAPSGWATGPDRAQVAFVPTIYGPSPEFQQTPPQVIGPMIGTFTLTSFTPATPLSGGQVALLSQRQQLKTQDGCLAQLTNWKTDGTVLYTAQWQCGSSFSVPVGATAEVDGRTFDLAGTFSGNRFTFTTPLNNTQVSRLRAGMPIDINGSPVCSAHLTGWDTVAGSWVESTSGFFTQPGGGACTPTGTALRIGDQQTVFSVNTVMNLYPYSSAYRMDNEVDCGNNKSPVRPSTGLAFSEPLQWCLDVVNLGAYGVQYGVTIRGSGAQTQKDDKSYFDAIHIGASAANAAVAVVPDTGAGIPIGLSCQTGTGSNTVGKCWRDWTYQGNVSAELVSGAGYMNLGNQALVGTTFSEPGFRFFSSGLAGGDPAAWDSQIWAGGGNGTNGSGAVVIEGALRLNTTGNWVAASNCGSLASSTKCLAIVNPNGNIMFIPAYGTY